jgi:hypothetical protein
LLIALACLTVLPANAQNIDIAPSVRFPSGWYSDSRIMPTMPPVTGAPYEARAIISNQFGRVPLGKAPLQARDSAGRTRTETELGPRIKDDGTSVDVREVGVTDPVSQCNFQWEEPWAAKGPPTAIVKCQRHKAEYAGEPMWSYGMKAGETHPAPDETDTTEAIGERTFDGLRALGFRRLRTIKQGNQTQVIDGEIWTSPEMKEIVATYVRSDPQMSIELQEIKLREPDGKLFYPPANYRIEPVSNDP